MSVSDVLLDFDEVREGFCRGCPCMKKIPATIETPEEILCPADFDFSDILCCREDDWKEVLEHMKEVERLCNLKY